MACAASFLSSVVATVSQKQAKIETSMQENVNTRAPDFGRHRRPTHDSARNIHSKVDDVGDERRWVEDVRIAHACQGHDVGK